VTETARLDLLDVSDVVVLIGLLHITLKEESDDKALTAAEFLEGHIEERKSACVIEKHVRVVMEETARFMCLRAAECLSYVLELHVINGVHVYQFLSGDITILAEALTAETVASEVEGVTDCTVSESGVVAIRTEEVSGVDDRGVDVHIRILIAVVFSGITSHITKTAIVGA
jgi:hypothetical protein